MIGNGLVSYCLIHIFMDSGCFLRMCLSRHAKRLQEKSLDYDALINLELHEFPEAVADSWQREHYEVDAQYERNLFYSTDIERIYDDAGGELLLLGMPGSGKTILLLELTRILLARAKTNDNFPIPVVLNLSSWSTQKIPLKEWFVKELTVRYGVPSDVGENWVRYNQVLPLLDGLDEAAGDRLEACIEAINRYRHKYGHMPMVVCTRSESYVQQKNVLHYITHLKFSHLQQSKLSNTFSMLVIN